MLYISNNTPTATVTSAPPTPPARFVSGKGLPHSKLNKRARAQLAADIVAGKVIVRNFTMKQAAAIASVSVPYVFACRNGGNGNGSLADRLVQASTQERLAAIRTVGIDKVVAWLCEAERVNVAAE